MKFAQTLMMSACLLVLASCGGGGGDSSTSSDSSGSSPSSPSPSPAPVQQSSQISGTAAAGAPIIGIVTVKDSLGATKTVNINADGSYTVDVAGMTGPFVFRAVGAVGGTTVALTSVATTSDLGGTINITPFTDLIVANIAGKAASEYFDSPSFSGLTTDEINTARNTLTARLLPILKEMGVSDSFDLLRSAFKADRTLFDAVMDVVKVTVDSTTNTAIIRDLINNTQIQDDLASRTDATVIAAPTPGSYTQAMTDLEQIAARLATLTDLFKGGLPSTDNTSLRSLFVTSGFLHGGMDLDTFLSSEFLLAEDVVGIKFSNPVIVSRASDGLSMTVRFTYQLLDGETDSFTMEFRKNDQGTLLMAGDGALAGLELQSINNRFWFNSQFTYNRNLELWVDTAALAVQKVGVTGPGLPVGGVTLARETGNGPTFSILGKNGVSTGTSWIPECPAFNSNSNCVDFLAVSAGASYTVKYYDNSNNQLGAAVSLTLEQPPVSNEMAQANAGKWFPGFTSFLPTRYTDLTDGMNVTIGWSKPSDSVYQTSNIGLSGGANWFSTDVDQSKNTLVVGTWSGSAPSSAPNVWIGSEGPYNRRFVTGQFYPQ